MTFLDYLCERLLAPAAKRSVDRLFCRDPFHDDTDLSFCALAHKPSYKDRCRSIASGMRGDEANLMKEFSAGEEWPRCRTMYKLVRVRALNVFFLPGPRGGGGP
jgi:hypothetical protein